MKPKQTFQKLKKWVLKGSSKNVPSEQVISNTLHQYWLIGTPFYPKCAFYAYLLHLVNSFAIFYVNNYMSPSQFSCDNLSKIVEKISEWNINQRCNEIPLTLGYVKNNPNFFCFVVVAVFLLKKCLVHYTYLCSKFQMIIIHLFLCGSCQLMKWHKN